MTIGICRGLLYFAVTSGSSLCKSYVSLGLVREIVCGYGVMGSFMVGLCFKTEPMTLGGMTIGTCRGLRLLKPGSQMEP